MPRGGLFFRAPPRVIGHRGAMAKAPENTLASFRRAAKDGSRWIELDVHLTSDGIPIVFHDDELDRTSDGSGPLSAITLAELQRLDAGTWFNPEFAGARIPTLAEAVALSDELGLKMNVEIKPSPGASVATAEAVVELIKTTSRTPQNILFSSFEIDALAAIQRAGQHWPRGLLLDDLHLGWRDEASQLGCSSVHPQHGTLTSADVVLDICETGLAIFTFTVNNPARAKQLLDWGVDAVITDDPAAILAVI
ncbi:MAG: glycerophosphoryl diester phosphodiesterase [Rhodospirillaceae bacterium]|nr:glycerophosphoryl diester phosphodiesterase [Rhodospirillaceae bacterium]